MEIKVNNRTIKAEVAIEAIKPTRAGIVESLEIVTSEALSPSEVQALMSHPIETDDGRILTGYAKLSSASYLLYRPTDETERRRELDQKEAALREMAAMMPDDIARLHPEMYPGMRFDGQEIKTGTRINWSGVLMRATGPLIDSQDCTPAQMPDMWEEVG